MFHSSQVTRGRCFSGVPPIVPHSLLQHIKQILDASSHVQEADQRLLSLKPETLNSAHDTKKWDIPCFFSGNPNPNALQFGILAPPQEACLGFLRASSFL